MSRFTNSDIRQLLSDLRSKIRNGQVTVYVRSDPANLRRAVASVFPTQESSLDVDPFTTNNFNLRTLDRFERLFAIPDLVSQDDIATALQKFINRRAQVWEHVLSRDVPVSATEADPIASAIQGSDV
jgi:hypothetical protein